MIQTAGLYAGGLLVPGLLVLGLVAPAAPGTAGERIAVSQDFLNDPRTIEVGRKVFETRCIFCHGRVAYPGRGPKLEPRKYDADFIYDRVTLGFRGMPSFSHEFSEEERRAVAAYILSKEFSN